MYIRTRFPRSLSVLLSIQEGRSLYCRIPGSSVSTLGIWNFPILVSYKFLASNRTSLSLSVEPSNAGKCPQNHKQNKWLPYFKSHITILYGKISKISWKKQIQNIHNFWSWKHFGKIKCNEHNKHASVRKKKVANKTLLLVNILTSILKNSMKLSSRQMPSRNRNFRWF